MLGDLISGGLKLLGGYLGDKATEKNNAANLAQQRELAEKNEALQREFATSGIQWKVKDAENAGIHPLYALGANTVSYSPQSMGGGSSAPTGLSSALADTGQDISRAIRATSSAEDRAYNDTMKQLNLRKAGLENDLLASQIAKNSGAAVGPPMPTGPSVVPEAKNFEERPRLQMGGVPWPTNPNTVNAEDLEKRYGDMSDIAGPYIFYKDRQYAFPSVQREAAQKYSSWLKRASDTYGRPIRDFVRSRKSPQYSWDNWKKGIR